MEEKNVIISGIKACSTELKRYLNAATTNFDLALFGILLPLTFGLKLGVLIFGLFLVVSVFLATPWFQKAVFSGARNMTIERLMITAAGTMLATMSIALAVPVTAGGKLLFVYLAGTLTTRLTQGLMRNDANIAEVAPKGRTTQFFMPAYITVSSFIWLYMTLASLSILNPYICLVTTLIFASITAYCVPQTKKYFQTRFDSGVYPNKLKTQFLEIDCSTIGDT